MKKMIITHWIMMDLEGTSCQTQKHLLVAEIPVCANLNLQFCC